MGLSRRSLSRRRSFRLPKKLFIISSEGKVTEPKYFKEKNGRYVILRERKCTIECVVEDNYDGLTYEWSDGGNSYAGPSSNNQTAFSGVGSNVTWQAPDKTKDLNITVQVYDEFGNVAGKILAFSVVSCGCAF